MNNTNFFINEKLNYIFFIIIGFSLSFYGLWVIFTKKVFSRAKCKIVKKNDEKCNWWFSSFFYTLLGIGLIIFGVFIMIDSKFYV